MAVFPLGLKQHDAQTLHIKWNDGIAKEYAVFDLRVNCGCAHCKDEFSGKRLVDPKNIPPSIYPKRIVPVGQYALQFVWSDGHDTGIYSFENLSKMGNVISESEY